MCQTASLLLMKPCSTGPCTFTFTIAVMMMPAPSNHTMSFVAMRLTAARTAASAAWEAPSPISSASPTSPAHLGIHTFGRRRGVYWSHHLFKPNISELWPNHTSTNFEMIIKDFFFCFFPSCMLDRNPLMRKPSWFPFDSLCETLNLNLLPSSSHEERRMTSRSQSSKAIVYSKRWWRRRWARNHNRVKGHVNYSTKIYAQLAWRTEFRKRTIRSEAPWGIKKHGGYNTIDPRTTSSTEKQTVDWHPGLCWQQKSLVQSPQLNSMSTGNHDSGQRYVNYSAKIKLLV